MTKAKISEIAEIYQEYTDARAIYYEQGSKIADYLGSFGYKTFDNVSGYSDGIMVSPYLLRHDDWNLYAHYDDEYDRWNIDDLQALPIELGDNDWNTGFHIIEL